MTVTASTEVTYHFVLTLQTDDGSTVTDDGTIPVQPGTHTRAQVLNAVRAGMLQRFGLTGCSVLFFSLAPDQL
ncbi:hypothetical protein [Streptomyces sp. NPDC014656]|uniref:hypothetical protein n=1 Tax=Streptomyces sp. NPDC014656 TaxID=3364878 RepID=UPI0036F8C0F7